MLHRRVDISRVALVAATLAAFVPARSEAGLIYYNNFNGASAGNGAATEAALFASGVGGTMTTNFQAVDVSAFAGTANNALNGDPAGEALGLLGGLPNNLTENGSDLQIAASTLGQTGIVLSFAIQATSTGFQSDQIQYSTDGMTFTNLGGAFTPTSSTSPGFSGPAGLQTFSFGTLLDNDARAAVRIVFNAGLANAMGNGNNRIDNIQINGSPSSVPEPSSVAMTGIALAGAAVAARRRRKRSA